MLNDKNDENKFDAFIDSVEEEIKNENWKRLWDKYGKFASGVSFAIIIASAIYSFWEKKNQEEREAISSEFIFAQNMTIESKDPDLALAKMRAISQCSQKDYATLAKFEAAALLKKKKDKEALVFYKDISENTKHDKPLADLAYIYYVNSSFDLIDDKELEELLPSFIKKLEEEVSKGPFHILALESLAYCYIKGNNKKKSLEVLEKVIKSEGVSQSIAERAKTVRKMIND